MKIMSNYKILGVNSDVDFCSCCGKQNLKKVVWIENVDSQQFNHYGTTCAAYLLSPKKGVKADINTMILKTAESWGLSVVENLPWIENYKDRIMLYGEALINAGWEKLFPTVDSKSAIYCNYIYPYKMRKLKAISTCKA